MTDSALLRVRWTVIGALSFVLGVTSGCAVPADDEAVAVSMDPISGGFADTEDKAVVGIKRVASDGTYLCSGSLISPNVVLTARHCVADASKVVVCDATEFGATGGPEQFFVTTEQTMPSESTDPSYHPVAQVVVPPGPLTFCGRDFALLVLASPIDATEATPIEPALDAEPEPTKPYSAVGYGETSADDPGSSGARFRRDGLQVGCVGASCIRGFVTDGEWVGGEGLCGGDSGGPALDQNGRVFAIASRAGLNCAAPMYVDLFGWGDWLGGSTRLATEQAGLAAPPWTESLGSDPGTEPAPSSDEGGCAIGRRGESGLLPWLVIGFWYRTR